MTNSRAQVHLPKKMNLPFDNGILAILLGEVSQNACRTH